MPATNTMKQATELIAKDKSKILGVKVGEKSIQPGDFVPKAEAQTHPTFTYALPSPNATYTIIAIDTDAPMPALNVLSPICHMIQPGYKVSDPSTNALTTDVPFIANWIAPGPPPVGGPHSYRFFLYQEPEGFDGKKYAPEGGKPLGNLGRMRYDLDGFLEKAGFGECVAANYFTCR